MTNVVNNDLSIDNQLINDLLIDNQLISWFNSW